MTTELDSAKAETLLRGIKIPPQPQIMVDIEMEMAMPDFDLAAVAQLVSRDVGLSGAVLKTVNSSFFGLKNRISSVHQAISLLGIQSLVSIINALSIRSALSDDQIVALNSFWDLSEEVASAAALIAKRVISQPAEEAYTLGLFHNAAIPLMMQRFDGYQSVINQGYAREDGDVVAAELEQLQTNHALVGYYIARTWKLPAHLCDAIAEHHHCRELFQDGSLQESAKTNLLAVLKLAEHLCGVYRGLGDAATDHEFDQLRHPILTYLGLTEIDLHNLADDLRDQGLAG